MKLTANGWLLQHEHERLPLKQWVEQARPTLCHDVSVPVQIGYHGLIEGLRKGTAYCFPGMAVIKQAGKWIAYAQDPFAALSLEGTGIIVHTGRALPWKGGSLRKEIVYRLEEVLDPASYSHTKQRQNQLNRPRNLLSKGIVRGANFTMEDLREVQALHARWLKGKLDQYTIEGGKLPAPGESWFPTRRYIALFEKYDKEYSAYVDSVARVYRFQGKIVAASMAFLHGPYAYEMATFSERPPGGPNRLTQAVRVDMFYQLAERGITHYCVGIEMRGGLRRFKRSWPHLEQPNYVYRGATWKTRQ